MTESDKWRPFLALGMAFILGGCDQMITPRNAMIIKDAETKVRQGDYSRAINLYEAALDDTPRCADIHFKLALLYEDKMNDPLNAMHHFKRYLVLSPSGSHAAEAKNFMKRDEVTLLTNLSGDSVVTRTEAARLRNENLSLRKEIEERAMKSRPSTEKPPPHNPPAAKAATKKSGSRTYVVKPGDTLASISRKFYKSSTRWKEIRNANRDKIENPAKLQPGQSLTIP
jgi:LysM repeat protein